MERLVSDDEYRRVIAERKAVKDPAYDRRGGIGEVERWVTPEGELCARLIVRYFKGEHDYDHYVND
jgi:hypothetical protein